MEFAIAAFEKLAGLESSQRCNASADGLVHPVTNVHWFTDGIWSFSLREADVHRH
jgi:hypothetical protein